MRRVYCCTRLVPRSRSAKSNRKDIDENRSKLLHNWNNNRENSWAAGKSFLSSAGQVLKRTMKFDT